MLEIIGVLLGMGLMGLILLAGTALFIAAGCWVVWKIFQAFLGKKDKES